MNRHSQKYLPRIRTKSASVGIRSEQLDDVFNS